MFAEQLKNCGANENGSHRCEPHQYWCPPRESNTAPTDYESAALTKHELGGLTFRLYWPSRKLFNLSARLGWRNLRSALASICRMRSRVTSNCLPTSSSV